jgi:hypothetical protein
MRLSDRNEGSIKALLIFALLAGNIVVALLRHGEAPSGGANAQSPRFSGRLHEAARFEEPPTP